MHRVVRRLAKQTFLFGCGSFALCASSARARADQPLLLPNSLVVSSSTYDRSQGALASLAVGTPIANTDTATTPAIAGNNYVDVWNNAAVDGSFGVTSAIQLTDIEPHSGHVFNTVSVPADQVVTSFSSKSELGLHITKDANGNPRLVFVAYAGAGVGAIDVSNSDAVAGQDTRRRSTTEATTGGPRSLDRTGSTTPSATPTTATRPSSARTARTRTSPRRRDSRS